jgi:hypothetical protein
MEDRPPAAPDPSFPPAVPPPPPPGPPPPTGEIIPWERPGLDAFTAFGRTVAGLLGAPRRAFESMPVTGAFGRPLVFGIIAGWIGVLASTFWNLLLRGWCSRCCRFASGRWAGPRPPCASSGRCRPHLPPARAPDRRRSSTCSCFCLEQARLHHHLPRACYASAPLDPSIAPAGDSVVGGLWGLVLAIIGLSAAHGISNGKAASAVLLPVLLCCGCFGLCFALFGAAIMSQMGIHH